MAISRYITITIIALLALIIFIEPSLAGNKFTKIGGGVAGSNREKFEILKNIAAIFGGFLILLGILSVATRNRFEGLLGMVTGRGIEAATVVPIVLIILGSLMIMFFFL